LYWYGFILIIPSVIVSGQEFTVFTAMYLPKRGDIAGVCRRKGRYPKEAKQDKEPSYWLPIGLRLKMRRRRHMTRFQAAKTRDRFDSMKKSKVAG
jgi:hypothetical protein